MNTLLVIAIAPAAFLLYKIYKYDPVEKEPLNLLLTLLLWGAISTIPASLLENILINPVYDIWQGPVIGYLLIENFVFVALVEEGCKIIFLKWKTWKNSAFDYQFDGIVYAVFVSLGFAIAENILYVFSYGFETGIVRAFTAIPGHCFFAVFMGFYYGQAKYAEAHGQMAQSKSNLVKAIVIPVLCHGTYDFLASFEAWTATILFFAFLIGMVYIGVKLIQAESAAAHRIYYQEPSYSTSYPFNNGL